MSNFVEDIFRLNVKINSLVLKHQDLIKEINTLKIKTEELEKQKQELENKNKILENKNNILTIAKSIPEKEEKRIVKKKINELLREIDICLEQININNI